MEELPKQCKESIAVPIYKKKVIKLTLVNYREISTLTTTYKILFNILLKVCSRCRQNYLCSSV